MEITDLLIFAHKNQASDLHLSVNNPPIVRIHGEILPLKMPKLTSDDIKQMLYSIMSEQQRSDYERDYEIDFAISFGDVMRFRINAFNTIEGPGAALRNIPTKLSTLDELKAPEVFKRLTELHKGLVLVTGPTGSGKSTTLAAMIDHINARDPKHILTIEDPVEFVHRSKRSLVNQREVGRSTKSFAAALRSALREDPDIILVGELRDLETIRLAMTAAETGHLVLGTLHTNSAAKTIDRIIDVFPADDKEMIRAMLSVSLEAVIAQNLLRKADGTGRVATHEILLATSAVRNLIREAKVPQIYSLIQTGSRLGMKTMKDSVNELLSQGIISQEVARSALVTSAGEEDTSLANPNRRPATGAPAPTQPSPISPHHNDSF